MQVQEEGDKDEEGLFEADAEKGHRETERQRDRETERLTERERKRLT